MKVMDNPYWAQAGQEDTEVVTTDAEGQTVLLNAQGDSAPSWCLVHNAQCMRKSDSHRLRTAALLKFRDLHGSWDHLANTPMPFQDIAEKSKKVRDHEGNAPMERRRFDPNPIKTKAEINRVCDTDPNWGGGWKHYMDAEQGHYLMVNEGGYKIERNEGKSAYPLQLLGWLRMDEMDGFMETFHHSILVSSNILGDQITVGTANDYCHSVRSAEMASLILYVFGDQMTEQERLITLTAFSLTNFTRSQELRKRRNSSMTSQSMQHWLYVIETLAPLADPRVYAGLDGRLTSHSKSKDLLFGIVPIITRELTNGLASMLLTKKNNAILDNLLDQDQEHASRAFIIMNCVKHWDDPDSILSAEGYGYTDEVLDHINVVDQVDLFDQGISAQGYLRWKAAGVTDPERILELARLGVKPEDGAHLDAMPLSWSDAWSE